MPNTIKKYKINLPPLKINYKPTIITPNFPVFFLDEALEVDFNDEDFRPEYQQPKVKQGNAEGYCCIKCKDFYDMAEINMPDKTFQCYSCREGLETVFK